MPLLIGLAFSFRSLGSVSLGIRSRAVQTLFRCEAMSSQKEQLDKMSELLSQVVSQPAQVKLKGDRREE